MEIAVFALKPIEPPPWVWDLTNAFFWSLLWYFLARKFIFGFTLPTRKLLSAFMLFPAFVLLFSQGFPPPFLIVLRFMIEIGGPIVGYYRAWKEYTFRKFMKLKRERRAGGSHDGEKKLD